MSFDLSRNGIGLSEQSRTRLSTRAKNRDEQAPFKEGDRLLDFGHNNGNSEEIDTPIILYRTLLIQPTSGNTATREPEVQARIRRTRINTFPALSLRQLQCSSDVGHHASLRFIGSARFRVLSRTSSSAYLSVVMGMVEYEVRTPKAQYLKTVYLSYLRHWRTIYYCR